jgi:hypothetical protein
VPSRSFSRRRLLQATGAGLLVGGGFGASTGLARAAPFGEPPPDKLDAMLAEELRVRNVLEVFLFGGVSQYESFYSVPEYGKNDNTHFHAFPQALIEQSIADCGLTGSPQLFEPFAQDEIGANVQLGPFAIPLRARPDLLDRMRICVTAHDLEPHEAAVPYALTGRPLGHAAMAGIGASVQRYETERDPTRKAPHAYVLRTTAPVLFELSRSADATGLHPASTRPLALAIEDSQNLVELLARSELGADKAAYDALVAGNIERYRQRLLWKGQGEPVRSARLGNFVTAATTVANSDSIRDVVSADLFAPLPIDRCGAKATLDATRMSLRIAAHLINHPTAPARYVCVVDGGILPVKDAGGYDAHDDCCPIQSRNLVNLLTALGEVINAPGERDGKKLDLDSTLVILNTEFGRTPDAQGATGSGRGHWPYGYPVVYLGGPVRGRSIHGACGADARATKWITPREHRVALLMALGIWPFSAESYNVSDVVGATHEQLAARSVIERVLGLT